MLPVDPIFLIVVPAKAGTQGRETVLVALDARFGRHDEIGNTGAQLQMLSPCHLSG
jgi:hypothetical protein